MCQKSWNAYERKQDILLIRRIGVALKGASLQHGLAESRYGIRYLDLDLREQFPQIMHDAIQIQLARSNDDMLPTFLDLRRHKWI